MRWVFGENGAISYLKRDKRWPAGAVQSFLFCSKSNKVSRSQALGQARFGLIDLAAARTTVRAVSAWQRTLT
jgi:hypothetical protein